MEENGQGGGQQDDAGIAEIDCDFTDLAVIDEVTVIESDKVDPEFE